MLCLVSLVPAIAAADEAPTHLWSLDSLKSVAGHKVDLLGDPHIVESDMGPVIAFDGDGDGLLVHTNPLADAVEFTIEVVFFPHNAYPANIEPRFVHIEHPTETQRRITIELRLNDQQQWYLDAFIKSELSQFVLINPSLVHPVEKWAHAAITYQNGRFTSYVNGRAELSAEVDYRMIPATAKTALGARMNRVHWFNGKIAQLRATHRALTPAEFSIPEHIQRH